MENFSVKKLMGEVLGTFALVLVGAGTAVLSGGNALMTALAFGLIILVLVAVGGGFYNPAVGLAAAVQGRLTWVEWALNSVAEVVGALLGSALLWLVTGQNASLGANSIAALVAGSNDFQGALVGILVETVITFFFVFAILRTTKETEDGTPNTLAPVVIGLTATAVILFAFTLTGGSLNPARSLAPALFQGGTALSTVWVFLVGPFLGAAIAAIVEKVL